MGSIISLAKDHQVIIEKPENTKDIEKIIEGLEIKPSEGLKNLWLNAKDGYFSNYWAIEIGKPGKIKTFKKGEDCDGFTGFRKVKDMKAYNVITLWAATDGRIPMYEMLEGEDKGKIVAFPFSDTAMYHTGKTVDDLFKLITELKWEDPDDDMQYICDKIMPYSTRDDGPSENSSDCSD